MEVSNSQFSQLRSAVAVFKGICPQLKTSDLQIIYLTPLISKTSCLTGKILTVKTAVGL